MILFELHQPETDMANLLIYDEDEIKLVVTDSILMVTKTMTEFKELLMCIDNYFYLYIYTAFDIPSATY